MELAPVPRRRPWSWRARTVLLVVVVAPVTALALVPAAFGLERYVTTSDPPGAVERGSVVLARDVPLGDLEVGDVVTFAPAGSADLVTGRVEQVYGAEVVAVVDDTAGGVPLGGRTTVARTVVAVPLVGYPFLGGARTQTLALLAVLAGLALGSVLLRDALRPTTAPDGRTTDRPSRTAD